MSPKLPSRHAMHGPERAPHRAFYYAMGLNEQEIARPLVGVVSSWNEAAPCNIALTRMAESPSAAWSPAAVPRASSPPSR